MVAESDIFSALILAIVQGITEWLPISSSGHIVIFENLLGYQGGLELEVALHFGTLMAIFVYFGRDIIDVLRDFLLLRFNTENGKMGLLLIVATIPAAIVGFFVIGFFETVLSNLLVVAAGFAITGMLLMIAAVYRIKPKNHKEEFSKFSYSKAFLIGLAQVLAIIPGVSRAGSTISVGVLTGLSEKNAMKFSFFMAIPIIFGANILALGDQRLPGELIWASFVSFLIALLVIHVMFRYILVRRRNFIWFGIYCLLLALGIFVWILV